MAVAFDARMLAGNSADGFNQDATGVTTLSSVGGITVGASASILVVPIVWFFGGSTGATVRSMSWNGTPMTEGPNNLVVLAGAESLMCAIWTLANPASGAKTLTASWTNSCDCYMSAASFTGASIQTADNTTATDVTTINVPTDSAGASIAVFNVDGTTPTVNFNKIFAEAPFGPGAGASYQIGGSGTNAHTFTGGGGTHQVLAGIHLIASTVAATTGQLGRNIYVMP